MSQCKLSIEQNCPSRWLTCIREPAGLSDPWGQDTDSLDREVQGFLFTASGWDGGTKIPRSDLGGPKQVETGRVWGCPYWGLHLQEGHHCPWTLGAGMPLRSCGAVVSQSCGHLAPSVPEPAGTMRGAGTTEQDTPGQINSRSLDSLGPVIAGLIHGPHRQPQVKAR
jgi:hypothetical protein